MGYYHPNFIVNMDETFISTETLLSDVITVNQKNNNNNEV